jgi:transposase-like protein
MKESKVIELNLPEETGSDLLTEMIRNGAQKILKEALEVEIEAFIDHYRELKTSKGQRRVVRNGYLPEREIVTGVGAVKVKVPRLRDREDQHQGEEIKFSSEILPPYLRKTKSLEELIPWLYLKGVSAGDFGDALSALVGKDAKGFSQPVVSRLKVKWKDEYEIWCQRDLSHKHYVYCWVDGIHCNVRMDDKQCILVVMGATATGKKELIAVEGGYRESKQSWRELLLKLKSQGLQKSPELFIGDGALGFWSAVSEVFPDSRWQRCWVHKTANVLNKLPKCIQPKAKKKIHDIYMADTKENALKAYHLFIKSYDAKYPKATECLSKDRESMLAFYDFPAEHWQHIRTTNPIESTFATVRLRTARIRGCFSSQTVINMAFKLCQGAEKRWRKLRGYRRLAEVIEGINFIDGISERDIAA